MRIERQHRRLQSFFASRARDFAQQLMVTGVDAVEVADGHRHRLEPGSFL
jgi:hypothetical protein